MSWWAPQAKGKSNAPAGTGYGGGNANKDRAKLLEGRKKAAMEESKRDAAVFLYLDQTQDLLKSKSVSDTAKLVSTLKETFRNQVPADWKPRQKLFMAALACFRLVISNYSELLGDVEDTESLNAAFDEFAQQARFLQQHDANARDQKVLVKEVLEVQSLAAQLNTHADLLMMDPHEHYRKALGPFRFEFVDKLDHHRFQSRPKSARLDARKMFQELSAYKTGLPIEYGSSIFVRAVEDRLDLLRALVLGPEDTPYANGCFVFDIYLQNYPAVPPKVQFLTTGGGRVRFNPNLYNCGKVCLSLLGTWDGPGWISGESTLLQVLVSIQSLILVNDPYFNEPGFASSQGTPNGTKKSDQYNANIRKQTLLYAVLPFCSGTHPYPEFNDAIEAHFRTKKMRLEKQLYKWMAKDSSLTATVNQILPQFARFNTKPNKPSSRAARAPKVAPAPIKEVNGIIELLDDEEVPVAKKQKTNEIVELLDEEDSKPAAVVREPIVLDLT